MTKRRSISTQTVKHLPQRTCLGCRKVKDKRELIRVVRVSGGDVEVDISGHKAGRGAYLCPLGECWEAGLKGRRLEHSLRTKLSQDNREELMRLWKDYSEEHIDA